MAYLAASVFPAPLSPVMMMLWSRFLAPATPPDNLPAVGFVMNRCALSATAYTWGWSSTFRRAKKGTQRKFSFVIPSCGRHRKGCKAKNNVVKVELF